MLFGFASLHAQIRQSDSLRAEQFVTEQRIQQQARQEEQQHQAQVDEMQRVDRQQAREQQELDRQRELQAAAAQQAQIQQQLQAQTQQKEAQQQQQAQSQYAALVAAEPAAHSAEPATTPRWSLKNFTSRDEIGLAAIAVLLGALAFKAGTPQGNRS